MEDERRIPPTPSSYWEPNLSEYDRQLTWTLYGESQEFIEGGYYDEVDFHPEELLKVLDRYGYKIVRIDE